MPVNRYIQPGDNADLTKERLKCTFDTDELSCVVYGGEEIVKRRREISRKVAADADFTNPIPHEFLSREAAIEATAKKTQAMVRKAAEYVDPSQFYQTEHFLAEVIGIEGHPLFVHYVMFLPALTGQADDELSREMVPRALSVEIIGTYAQTEMGHGTNIRELETTATFDKSKQEFIIHTPTRRAMKWWAGNLGKMSNYAVVCAQLYIDGKNLGPHNFLVQLRDEHTHQPLPGITVGDIGPKMGFNTTDNGFLGFDRVRIPRQRMLMKHAKVSSDGIYTPPMHAKLNYAAMAATIAIRYSAVRRQGRIEEGNDEVQILDYQTQQYRLFPQLARAYAVMFAGQEIADLYKQTLNDISHGNTDLLPDLHAISSGLKSTVSHLVGLGIEQCRMACGGHGYSDASGLPKLYAVQIGACTYEGENMVMLQQTARYLMKAVQRAAQGQRLSHSIAYLAKKDNAKSLIGVYEGDMDSEYEAMIESIEHAARRLAIEAAAMWRKRIEHGESKEKAWNGCTVEMNRAARLHTRLFMARAFHRRVQSAPSSVREVLHQLLSLYLHYECVDMSHHLLEDGHCNGSQIQYLKTRLYEDLTIIRPNAVSIVDSFDFSDRELNSVLGRRDGNVYDALYEWAKSSQLNYTHVLPAVSKYILPMMGGNRAKL